ncbi:Tumor protein p73 [Amphibalanus amphitrite]|uniref:Tumor protein p73 n=1 Tax=Amphibalanus amphitrite TaxID=1232801 RepID=A0A6A4VP86_AMPAM|nr:Tumor protein p73 [Amphibalanus amphitrite]
MDMIRSDVGSGVMDAVNDDVTAVEQFIPVRSPVARLGSAPAVNRWPGVHAFQVTVYQRLGTPAGRQPPYAYSRAAGKLYTDMLVAVPFRFSYTAVGDPRRLEIRAQPVYLDAQHVQNPVRRCPHHQDAALMSNVQSQHVRHVLQTQHARFRYDENGDRCSVVVPLEPLQPATDHYEVLYEFTCMNTCVGGMNRRRILALFTLEECETGQVLGRQTIEVKVCKCPHRDLKADEKRLGLGRIGDKPDRKRRLTSSPPASCEQRLVVEVDDEEMFRAVTEVRDSMRRYRRRVNPQHGQAPPPGRQ